MKTVQLLSLSLLSIMFFSCQPNEVSEKGNIDIAPITDSSSEDSMQISFENSTVVDVNGIIKDLPEFKSEQVRNFAVDFNIFIDQVAESLSTGDSAKIQTLITKSAVITDVLEQLKGELNEQDKALLKSYLDDQLATIQSAPHMKDFNEIVSELLSKE